jgi:hypothetical protein
MSQRGQSSKDFHLKTRERISDRVSHAINVATNDMKQIICCKKMYLSNQMHQVPVGDRPSIHRIDSSFVITPDDKSPSPQTIDKGKNCCNQSIQLPIVDSEAENLIRGPFKLKP